MRLSEYTNRNKTQSSYCRRYWLSKAKLSCFFPSRVIFCRVVLVVGVPRDIYGRVKTAQSPSNSQFRRKARIHDGNGQRWQGSSTI